MMTEQGLAHTTDTPSTSGPMRPATSVEVCGINSPLRHSTSGNLNASAITEQDPVATVPHCTEDSERGCMTECTMNTSGSSSRIFSDDDRASMSDPRVQRFLLDCARHNNESDSDNDSFDDEEDTIVANSIASSISVDTSNYVATTCPICFETAFLRASSCCTFQCCFSCWRAHISAVINDGRIKIPCVSSDCSKYLTKESIMHFIRHDPVLHERYLKLYINANQNPRAKTCPRCSHLYSLDQNDAKVSSKVDAKSSRKNADKKIPKQVQCSECSLVWCFRCSAPWHENMTCKQFVKGDKLLMKWINQKNEDQWNARKCPKCASFIQRAGGCPHMTCSSCHCEFCYLCGRQYRKIPIIGHHNNKYSMFGCPYNLHPKKPWLRRTIRGSIATGVIVASPVIIVGAVTAAVTVLPSLGVYKLVKHIRARRRAAVLYRNPHLSELMLETQLETNEDFSPDELYPLSLDDGESMYPFMHLYAEWRGEENSNDAFPLSIFADMDVENLFTEEITPSSDIQTKPTTAASEMENVARCSSNDWPECIQQTGKRHHSIS